MSSLSTVSNQSFITQLEQLKLQLEEKNSENLKLKKENDNLQRRIEDVAAENLELIAENIELNELKEACKREIKSIKLASNNDEENINADGQEPNIISRQALNLISRIKALETQLEIITLERNNLKKDVKNLSKEQLKLKNEFLIKRNEQLFAEVQKLQGQLNTINLSMKDRQNFSYIMGILTGISSTIITALSLTILKK